MNSSLHFKARCRGFTLIELLCSMALFAVVGGALFLILNNTSETLRHTRERIDSRRSGRSIIGQIGTELELATLPAKRRVHIADITAKPSPLGLSYQFVTNVALNPSSPSDYKYPHNLFWQAPLDGESQGGDPVIGYFIRWIGGSNPRAMLCRLYIDASPANINSDPPKYRIHSDPTNWLTSQIVEEMAPGVEDKGRPSKSYQGWFADNVIGLWVRCYDPIGNEIRQDALSRAYNDQYDSRLGYSYTSGGVAHRRTMYKRPTNDYIVMATLPFSAEVGIVILDEEHAKKLTAIPNYNDSAYVTGNFRSGIQAFVDDLPESVRPGAKIFTTRINFLNSQ